MVILATTPSKGVVANVIPKFSPAGGGQGSAKKCFWRFQSKWSNTGGGVVAKGRGVSARITTDAMLVETMHEDIN